VLAQTKAAPNVTKLTHRWLQLPAWHVFERSATTLRISP